MPSYNLNKFKDDFLSYNRGLGAIAPYKNGDTLTDDVDKVIFIGERTEEYNCTGFAIGIRKFSLSTGYPPSFEKPSKLMDDFSDEEDERPFDPPRLVRYWLKREIPGEKKDEILPSFTTDNSFISIEVVFDPVTKKIKIKPEGNLPDDLSNLSDYTPQFHDVALFYNAEGGHFSIYTDIDNILIDFLYTKPNTTEPLNSVTLNNKWYSKCGKEYLVAHSLERLCFKSEQDKFLDFTKIIPIATTSNPNPEVQNLSGTQDAMGDIFNKNGYGEITYIFRKI